ncbi:hypothetical protein VNO77_11449 [Canavalia gladiata]|uniref:Tripeptidyl-peptidase II n=1 Tax=Canavalia gladiata TaxID=3824 RepID=A0AAN9MBH5_CANGL
MKDKSIFLHFFYTLLLLLGSSVNIILVVNGSNDNANHKEIYIVYMGAAHSTNASLRNDHTQILNSVLRRNEKALVRNYKHGFSGFAARLSKEEANKIAQKPGVVSVFLDPILKLHTTNSWNFLKHQTPVKINTNANTASNSSTSSNTIIGIFDSGIWPEAASFTDKGIGPIPSRWKGKCMTTNFFNSSNCNKKLIGARYYADDRDSTVRDTIGHGTHVASTAVGVAVTNASYYGLGAGIATGGSPESRLAVYKVCSFFGCSGSTVLAAFDDAIADGVDIISLSLGSPASSRPNLMDDPIAIGAFHAVERGILVVCSAGNDGPNSATVTNDSPWILTVAASSTDRDFQSNIVLDGNKIIKGKAINFSPLSHSPKYPLIDGESAKTSDATPAEARRCHPNSLAGKKVKGKIVVCDGINDIYSTTLKVDMVKREEGVGLIHITNKNWAAISNYGDFPATEISPKDATTILHYINSTSNPLATILPTITVLDYKPAPEVMFFSSRGPATLSKSILKKSKTSYLSNVAIQNNNLKAPITTDSGSIATPYDYGAGEITISRSLQPGLVYETSTIDYLNYLCYIGLDLTTVKIISRTVPRNFSCPKDSSSDHISNINYPSIAISNFNGTKVVNVSRTVTNVGEEKETIYSSVVDAPSGVNVTLTPDKLHFTNGSKTLSYQVIFSSTLTSLKEDLFGSITWSNGKSIVRSPFVLTN